MPVEIALARRIADIERAEWDALVGPGGSPFLEWDWLEALWLDKLQPFGARGYNPPPRSP